MILVAPLVVAMLVTWLIARRRATDATPRSGNAEAIRAERLARSEISAYDFRTTLAALREASSR